jgi:hypothetical protein
MLLLQGHRTSDKDLRNEVVIILSMIARAQRSNNILFATTGLLQLLIRYIAELHSTTTAIVLLLLSRANTECYGELCDRV